MLHKVSYEDDSQEYPEVYRLKQELMEFYQMEEEQIALRVD